MNIADILLEHRRTRPESAAIIDSRRGGERVTTFARLEEASARAAGLLVQHGLRPGDAVLVFHPMSAELYVALLAIFRLRLIAMFLDPSAGREHIERCCALHAPRALIASAKAHLLRLWSPALRRIPLKFVIGLPLPGAIRWSRSAEVQPHADIQTCESDTPALLTFTSGSTGQPKAAVRTHGFLLAQHRSLAQSLELQAGDVDLTTMPIVLLANLASGVTSLIPRADLRYPGAIEPAPIVAQVQTHGAVSSTASPAFFERLARYCSEKRLTLPSFKKLFSGGAPVFPRLLDQMQALAPAADVVAVYGSTEAEPIAHIARRQLRPEDLGGMRRGQGLLAGLPVESIQLRILRDQWGAPVGPYTEAEFAATGVGAGEPGEIVVSGDHVLAGYLHGHGDHETKFRVDGVVWHRTGDAGYLDRDGRVWLLGRCVARIKDGHGVLYPFAAETAVYQDPVVRRAAMVAHKGRRILAVEFYEHKSLDCVEALKTRMVWTLLDEVRVCKQIPVDKRHNAKIDYPALAEMLEGDWKQSSLRRFRWMLYGVTALFAATEALALTGLVPHLRPVSLGEISSNVLFAIGFGSPFVLQMSSLPGWRVLLKTLAAGLLLALLLLIPWAIRQDMGIAQWIARPKIGEVLLAHTVTGVGLASMTALALRAWRSQGQERTTALLYLLPAAVSLVFTFQAGVFWYYIASVFPVTYDAQAYVADDAYGFAWSFVVGRLFQTAPLVAAVSTAIYLAPPPALVFVYALQLRARRPPAIDVVTVLLVLGLVGYSLYFLYPVAGPLFAFGNAFPNSPPPAQDLLGQHMLVESSEPAPRNGMPSLHMASVILAYWHARLYGPWARFVAGIFILGTFLATMGLGEHFFVDLVVALPFTLAGHALCTPARQQNRQAKWAAAVGAVGLVVLWYLLLFFGTALLLEHLVLTWTITLGTGAAVWLLEWRLYEANMRMAKASS